MTIKHTLLLMAFAGLGLASCQTKTAETAAAPGGQIGDQLSLDTAKKYVENYKRRAGIVDSVWGENGGVQKKYPRPNTRCVWFDKEKLRKILADLDAEKGDGVRFYLAAYDSTYNKNALSKTPDRKYWNYNTLVMVSTVQKIVGADTLHFDSYSKRTGNLPGKGFIVGAGAGPENRGEMCPPPSNCPAIGATLIQ
jgi:hypothetical protein